MLVKIYGGKPSGKMMERATPVAVTTSSKTSSSPSSRVRMTTTNGEDEFAFKEQDVTPTNSKNNKVQQEEEEEEAHVEYLADGVLYPARVQWIDKSKSRCNITYYSLVAPEHKSHKEFNVPASRVHYHLRPSAGMKAYFQCSTPSKNEEGFVKGSWYGCEVVDVSSKPSQTCTVECGGNTFHNVSFHRIALRRQTATSGSSKKTITSSASSGSNKKIITPSASSASSKKTITSSPSKRQRLDSVEKSPKERRHEEKTIVDEIKDDLKLWNMLWPGMKSDGWTSRFPKASEVGIDRIYLRPGAVHQSAVEGIDKFSGYETLMAWIRKTKPKDVMDIVKEMSSSS